MTTSYYTFTLQQKEEIITLLWDHLGKDKEHKDRRWTGYGTKTQAGLIACLENIVQSGPSWIRSPENVL